MFGRFGSVEYSTTYTTPATNGADDDEPPDQLFQLHLAVVYRKHSAIGAANRHAPQAEIFSRATEFRDRGPCG